MSKLKKSLQFCMSLVLALSFLIAPFPKQSKTKTATSAPTESQLIDDKLFQYVTISTDGQTLTNEEIKTIDSDGDGKNDTSFVFSNRTVTLTFNPLAYGYITSFDASYFYAPTTESVTITKVGENFPAKFTYHEKEYTYTIINGDKLTVDGTEPTTSVTDSPFIDMVDTETTRTFTFITSYTLKADAPSTTFTFAPYNYITNSDKTNHYTINFERPIVNFKNDDVTSFTCTGIDVGDTPYVSSKIEKDLSYENVKFQITNNNYTENNPLYFDINHDGFIYTFKLFSKTYDLKELLFVEYYDEQKEQNHESLATTLDEDGNVEFNTDSPVYKYIGETTNFNMFSIDFDDPGRYEIAVYDETYKLNLNDNNFYSTSFYIKTDDALTAHTAFENAYAIMQKYDEEGNLSDYIVSGSTQNSNVKVTLKNLLFYFEHDDVINSFTPTENMPELPVIEFIKTILTGGVNEPVSTLYSVEEIKEKLEENPDFIFECSDDAFYQIIIRQYEIKDGVYKIKATTPYQFTIVKQPKIQFTVFKVDENKNRIPIPDTNQFETEVEYGQTPYTTTPKNYEINIDSGMEVTRFFSAGSPGQKTFPLEKTYLNKYTINYAMQAVKIEKVDVLEPGTTDKVMKVLGVQFFGVGKIDVDVTVDSVTKTYTVESGEVLVFEDYGIYSFSIVDSMGTPGTQVIKYTKPVSTSAILLVALLGVIVLAVVLFVVSSRGKLKTR